RPFPPNTRRRPRTPLPFTTVGVDSGQGHRVELIGEGVEAGSRAGFALENGIGDEDRRSAMRSPSLPNRTGGSPASGFPVSGCSFEEEHAFRAVPKDARQTFGSTQ